MPSGFRQLVAWRRTNLHGSSLCVRAATPTQCFLQAPSRAIGGFVGPVTRQWMSTTGSGDNTDASDSRRPKNAQTGKKKATKMDHKRKGTHAMGYLRGGYTQGKKDYKYKVNDDGTPELEDIRDDSSISQAIEDLQLGEAYEGAADHMKARDEGEANEKASTGRKRKEGLSARSFDEGGASEDEGKDPFDRVAPEDIGRERRKVSDVGNENFRDRLLSDKRYMRQAGMHGVSDSEDWPEEEKHVRSMPMWMMWHYARSELDSEVEQSHSERKSAKPTALVNLPMRDSKDRAYATGRRKTSTARVWVKAGDGGFTVNGMPLAYYFSGLEERKHSMFPLIVLEACGGFDVMCTVKGGGFSGQAGAIKHGLARALAKYDPYLKPTMKQYQLLKRDPRMVERKKPGQAKARKKFTWVKR
eukprot:gb/GECG01006466.1/.p1 GENE.gb/GECG01006466.1/~~gb/GECG01006466.1/.p1  ORF type:complete len:415 (+),score=64.65 gb/GECG01006466.1/:1-1245(+)